MIEIKDLLMACAEVAAIMFMVLTILVPMVLFDYFIGVLYK
jgi:hypothetical protein